MKLVAIKKICLFLLIFVIVFFLAIKFYKGQPETVIKTIPLEKPIGILFLGADSVIPGHLKGWYGRSDLIVLLYINPFINKVSILSIPRDTQISLKKYDVTRINAANQIGGYQLAKRSVERLLGIKIDHVFVFSIQSVIDVLDSLGTFKIFVPKHLSYHDKSANLHIEIKAGLQEMRGKQLMNFLRYRSKAINGRGDIGRIERQQIFFRAAIRKLKEENLIFKLPEILYRANKVFLTDMKFSETFKLGKLLKTLSNQCFESYILPGNFSPDGSWIVNKFALQSMMNKITSENEPIAKQNQQDKN